MSSFLVLASVFGLIMAFFGFYSSVRLDLPLGPTDVTLGCCLIFLAYAFKRLSPATAAAVVVLCVAVSISGCGQNNAVPLPDRTVLRSDRIWLAKVKNSTDYALLLPSQNPLRSAAEMFGKLSPDYRQNVMDLLRDALRRELEQKGYVVRLPEEIDDRFPPFPADTHAALQLARTGKLSGLVLVSEILRWEDVASHFVRVATDFKLIRVQDGAVLWNRRVQRGVSTPAATNQGQAYTDAIKAVVNEIFNG